MKYFYLAAFCGVFLALIFEFVPGPAVSRRSPISPQFAETTEHLEVTAPTVPVHSDDMDHSQFSALETDAFEKIERAEHADPALNDPEGPPRTLFPVTAVLGRIAVALRENPALVPEGIAFYRRCATQDSDLFSVRAVCLRDLKYWENRSGAADDSDSLNVPPDVSRIVGLLPAARD